MTERLDSKVREAVRSQAASFKRALGPKGALQRNCSQWKLQWEVTVPCEEQTGLQFYKGGKHDVGHTRKIDVSHPGRSRFTRVEVCQQGKDGKQRRAVAFLPMCDDEGLFLWNGRVGVLPRVRRVPSKREPEAADPGIILEAEDVFEAWLSSFDHPLSPIKLLDCLNELLLGARRSRAWLLFEDYPSKAASLIARTTVILASISESGLKTEKQWGWPHRELTGSEIPPLCPVHTGQDGAGLTRYLAFEAPSSLRAGGGSSPPKKLESGSFRADSPHAHSSSAEDEEGSRGLRTGLASLLIPYLAGDEPRRSLIACSTMTHAQALKRSERPRVRTRAWEALEEPVPGTNLLTAFAFWHGYNHEDALVISRSAAAKLAMGREASLYYGIPWMADPEEPKRLQAEWLGGREGWPESSHEPPLRRRKLVPRVEIDSLLAGIDVVELPDSVDVVSRLEGRFRWPAFGRQVPWPARARAVRVFGDMTSPHRADNDTSVIGPYRAILKVDLVEEQRPAQPGDKLSNLHGNKGVIATVLPDDEMPRVVPPGSTQAVPVDVVANPIGVLNRGNFGQLAEAVASWRAGRTDDFVVEEDLPLGNLLEWAQATDGFDSAGRLWVELPGRDRIRAVCGWNFWMRPEQEACREARVALQDSPRLPRSLLPRLFKSKGVQYGEMVGWALAVRDGARAWIEKDLLQNGRFAAFASYDAKNPRRAKKGSADPDPDPDADADADGIASALRAWDLLCRLSLGVRGYIEHERGNEKKIPLSSHKIRTADLPPRADSRSSQTAHVVRYIEANKNERVDWPELVRLRAESVVNQHKKLREKLKNQETASSYVEKAADSWLSTLGETFFGSRRHRPAQPGRKESGDKSPGELRRSPFVRWALCRTVRPAARLVIVPAPELELDRMRLPWWLCIVFFAQPDRIPALLRDYLTSPTGDPHTASDIRHLLADAVERLRTGPGGVLSPDQRDKLENTLAQRFSDRWAVVHRTPVLHFGSIWPLRVEMSCDPAPVAGLPLGVLPPMGADFDGDTVFIAPVLSQDAGVVGFCRKNSPLVATPGGGKQTRCFSHPVEPGELVEPDERAESHPPDVEVFPLSKDLAAAYGVWQRGAQQSEAQTGDAPDAKSTPSSPADWLTAGQPRVCPGIEELDSFDRVVGLGWWQSAEACAELNPGAYELMSDAFRAAKRDHLPQKTLSDPPCSSWWTLQNLNKCVRFFYESKKGAGEMGGLYRRAVYGLDFSPSSDGHEPPEARESAGGQPSSHSRQLGPERSNGSLRHRMAALQALLERLQQKVLKFKGRSEILLAKDIETLWNRIAEKPADPISALDEYLEQQCSKAEDERHDALKAAAQAVKDVLEEHKTSWDLLDPVIKSLTTDGSLHRHFFVKGQPLDRKQRLLLDPADPRYLLLPHPILLVPEDS
jgi:hypothetical protein